MSWKTKVPNWTINVEWNNGFKYSHELAYATKARVAAEKVHYDALSNVAKYQFIDENGEIRVEGGSNVG
jgi:hypothetical protein